MSHGAIRRILLLACLLVPGCAQQHWELPTKGAANKAASEMSAPTSQHLPQAEVLRLLMSDQYEALDRYFTDLQRQYAEGVISDETLRDQFRAFYPTDHALAAHYDSWVQHFPGSYVAHLARAIYYKKVGQESRGENYISETTEAQLGGMNEAFAKALKDLHACVDLDPKPTLAYGHALDISAYTGAGDERELQDLAAQVDADNIIVRIKYMIALEPRWGGSVEKMQAFLQETRRTHLPASKLRVLEAIIFEDQGHVDYDGERWDAAADSYLHAFELNPNDLESLRLAAQARFALQDWKQVIELYTRYLARVPNNVIALRSRGWAYDRIDDPQAVADLSAAAVLGDAFSQNRLGEYNFYGLPGVVHQDRESAIKWFRMAAEQKYPDGMANLQKALAGQVTH
jgi:tetratricopeptide (TPR) repeat protein